jgi:flagellar basal body-associated protein FliL
MKLKEKEYKILEMIANTKGGALARNTIQNKFNKDIKNSLSKLTQSGCLRFIPNILEMKGRGNVYYIQDIGYEVYNHMNSNEVNEYEISS